MKYYVLIDGRVFEATGLGSLRTLLNLFKPEFSIRVKEGIFYNNEVTFKTVAEAVEYYERKWREAEHDGYRG